MGTLVGGSLDGHVGSAAPAARPLEHVIGSFLVTDSLLAALAAEPTGSALVRNGLEDRPANDALELVLAARVGSASAMLRESDASQIRKAVVERIAVDVMDLVALRNRPVRILPDGAMERSRGALEVVSMGRGGGVGVSVVALPFEFHALRFRHEISVSDSVMVESAAHPRFSVHTR